MATARLIAPVDVLPNTTPGYIASNWYLPGGVQFLASGGALTANVIRLIPGQILQTITLNALGVRCTTLAAGGNVQAAVYANSATTMRPTGTALASTASMSTAAIGSLTSAVSIQLAPGMYWWAINSDNATNALTQLNGSNSWGSIVLGASAQNIALQSGTGLGGVSFPTTFGTWPDLTGQTFSDQISNAFALPAVQFKVASVP